MGRTNITILALGLFACVALSLMMQHAVKKAGKDAVHPVVKQVDPVFRPRLEERCAFRVVERDGRRLGELSIRPRQQAAGHSLARTMGMFVWRMQDDSFRIDALDVLVDRGKAGAEPERIRVQDRGSRRAGKPAKQKQGPAFIDLSGKPAVKPAVKPAAKPAGKPPQQPARPK